MGRVTKREPFCESTPKFTPVTGPEALPKLTTSPRGETLSSEDSQVALPTPSAADTVPKPEKEDPDTLQSPAMETGRLNVNLATERQLTLLPGIGPALAGRIVTHRQTNGRFNGPGDLLEVKGIGSKTLARFEGMIVFD